MNRHEKAVEAAAVAICPYQDCVFKQVCQVIQRPECKQKETARAAIAAFLENVEPSEAMQAVAVKAYYDPPGPLKHETRASLFWRAMSKALAEELKAP